MKKKDPALQARAKLRIKKLGGSAYMSNLAKQRHSKLSKAERLAIAMKMVEARRLKKLA